MGFASAAITAIKNNRSLQRLTSGFKQAKEETARRHPPKKLSGRAMSRVQMARRRPAVGRAAPDWCRFSGCLPTDAVAIVVT